MQAPQPRNTPIDDVRVRAWVAKFGTYWTNPNRMAIEAWIDAFNPDRDAGARVLDAVLFLDQNHIYQQFRTLLANIYGWHADPAQRQGKWFFVPFSSSVGESGDTMVHWFRNATNMGSKRYSELFCHRSELVSKGLGPDDTVVLIDDFAGTGTQASDSWRDFFGELLAGGPRVILMLVCATNAAQRKISEDTDFELHASRIFGDSDNLFHEACTSFNTEEKDSILKFCKRASKNDPKGWGDCGLLLVFAHKAPNNSIAVLHSTSQRWTPLFPRRGD